jgi:hypothetical protein
MVCPIFVRFERKRHWTGLRGVLHHIHVKCVQACTSKAHRLVFLSPLDGGRAGDAIPALVTALAGAVKGFACGPSGDSRRPCSMGDQCQLLPNI